MQLRPTEEAAGLSLDPAADDVVGPEGTAPNTVAPLEFVVFKIDELMLPKKGQKNIFLMLISFFF